MNSVNAPTYWGASGVPTNASFVGAWINIQNLQSLGFQVTMPGTGNPQGSWGVDITDDDEPNGSGYIAFLGATPLTLTAAMVAQDPAGAGVAINYLFEFSPRPQAKWARFKYTRVGGGDANARMKCGYNGGW